MRNTYHNKAIARTAKGKFIGVNLGADHCAEHEFGIDRIKKNLGILNKDAGYSSHRITSHGNLAFKFDDKALFIYVNQNRYHLPEDQMQEIFDEKKKDFAVTLKSQFKRGEENPTGRSYDTEGHKFVSAWDEGSFAIMFHKSLKADYEALSKALEDLDVCISVGGRQVFANGGLSLLISSRIPDEWEQELKASQRDADKLEKTSNKTGIHKTLKKAGKEFFALSPRWDEENKGEVIFWLNPIEQDIYNYGWFNVGDLTKWANNEGPVMK